jgi:hypothetical protein
MTVLDAALGYVGRGWAVIPIPLAQKAPRLTNWQELRITRANLPKYFNGRPANIGVLLGEPSAGLIDIDLDAPEAPALADYFLPATGCVFGRQGKPKSHCLYIVDSPLKTEQFRDTKGAVLVELRSTGGQTIVPPSTHPSGEPIQFYADGAPATVTAMELREAVARLAAATLVARHWPEHGSRHRCALALAGALLRAGRSAGDVQHFVQCVAWAAGDEEWQHRGVDVVPTTEQRLADGRDVTGMPTLSAMLGEAVVTRLTTWMGLTVQAPGGLGAQLLGTLDGLGENPPLKRVEAALRIWASKLRGADALKREVERGDAIELLKQLGVKSSAGLVDAALKTVEPAGGDGQGQALLLADVPPWPSAVDGAQLLSEIAASIRRFIVLSAEAADALSLWVLHTHAFDSFSISPYLAITSPTKQCGKTTLLEVLSNLVPRPLPMSNVTSAAVFRVIELKRPTLAMDEVDTYLKSSSDELRGVLNAGHKKATANVLRTVGDDHEPRLFSVWAPKIIAKIGVLPDTLSSRSIIISMQRRTRDEPIEPLRDDRLGMFKVLAQKAARWAKDHADALRHAEPDKPEGFNNRLADNWHPLFAVADLAGGEWPARAREAALALAGSAAAEDDAVIVKLLRDIRDLFDRRREAVAQGAVHPKNADKFASRELAEQLGKLAERPWSEFKRGKPITQAQLARLLKPYEIASKNIRKVISDSEGEEVLKGYEREQFKVAFTRYLGEPSAVAAGGVSVADAVAGDVAALGGEKAQQNQRCSGVAARRGQDRRPRRRVRLSEVPD